MFAVSALPLQLGAVNLDTRNLLPEDQKKVSESTKGKVEYSSQEIDQMVRVLMQTGNYDQLEVVGQNDSLIFKATVKKEVRRVEFVGLKEMRRRQLIEYIDHLTGERFERSKAIEAGESVKQHMVEAGYLEAKVSLKVVPSGRTAVTLQFLIEEGNKTEINEVIVDSPNAPLNQSITKLLARYSGRPFNNSTIQELEAYVYEFLKSNRYLVAKLEQQDLSYGEKQKRVSLRYTLTDPVQYQIIFEGNQYYSSADLLRSMELNSDELSLVEPSSELPQKVKNFYIKKGFAHVKMEVEEEVIEKSFLRRIRIRLVEGPRVKLDQFVISGRLHREPQDYRNFIEQNSNDTVASGWYYKDGLDLAYKNLITDMNNQGYLRAKIVSSRTEFSKDKERATVFLTLDEGPRTKIEGIKIKGNHTVPKEQLVKALGLSEGADLKLIELERGLNELKLYYGKLAMLEMKILNEDQESLVQYSGDGSKATIYLEIYEGPPIKVASIVIEGNDLTKDEVIMRDLEFKKGDLLTIDKLNDSILQLNRSGLFSRLDIRSLEVGTTSSQRTIIVSVSERNPGLIKFGVGVNNERGFTVRGFTGISYNNLWGTARALTGRIELQEDVDQLQELEQRYSITYLEPYLLNTRTKGRFNYSFTKEVTEVDPKVLGQSQRADILLERDLTHHTKLTWTLWGVESFEEFRDDGSPDVLQQVAYIGPTLDVDYRDSIFSPTRGQYFRLTSTYADKLLGSSDGIQFLKNDASYTFYVPIGSPRWVFAQAIRCGYLKNIDPTGAVPTRYAFFLGGYSTIRGFGGTDKLETIPNEIELPTGNSDITPLISTESYYYLFKSEVRFPIYDPLGGVVFYDGGEVNVLGFDFDTPYRQSFGVGFRINTPVGPVVLDYARKIDPQCFHVSGSKECERPDRFHFSVGTY